ncbi:glycosyltransferase [Streptomyces aureus]
MIVQPSICLCMIVKNESVAIERCLASVRDLITTWVISDTGSTDGTQKIIRNALRDIPGELHEEPWVDFGQNRSLNISHARGKADYLLLLDADHEIRQDDALPPLTADAYMLRHEGAFEYWIRRLVRGTSPGATRVSPTNTSPPTSRPISRNSTLWSSWTMPTEDRVTTSPSVTHVC